MTVLGPDLEIISAIGIRWPFDMMPGVYHLFNFQPRVPALEPTRSFIGLVTGVAFDMCENLFQRLSVFFPSGKVPHPSAETTQEDEGNHARPFQKLTFVDHNPWADDQPRHLGGGHHSEDSSGDAEALSL